MRMPFFAILSALAISTAASGGQPLALQSTTEARGEGQVVVTITFANVSGDRIHDARIDAAVPAGYRYVQGSAQGPGAALLYSVDGGERFAPEHELSEPPDGLTHVRWVLPGPFDPGARGQVRFMVTRLTSDPDSPEGDAEVSAP
jgi:hypothetical protein